MKTMWTMARAWGIRGLLAMSLAGCGGGAAWEPVRPSAFVADAPDDVTLVWVGRGECERLDDGVWTRHPELDYEFSVEQHRRADGRHWDSVKTMRRLAEAYDGVAGPRTQVLYFEQAIAPASSGVEGTIRTSVGDGRVQGDAELREVTIQLAADVSSMAPFDRYVITQHYDYEGGALEETVELNDGAQPWVRNHEHATLLAPTRFEGAPTVLR